MKKYFTNVWPVIALAAITLGGILLVEESNIAYLEDKVELQQNMIDDRDQLIKDVRLELNDSESNIKALEDARSSLLIDIQKYKKEIESQKEYQFLRGGFVGCGVGLLAIGIPPEVSAEPCKAISEDLDKGDYWKKEIPSFDESIGN